MMKTSKTILYNLSRADLKAFAMELLSEVGAVTNLTPEKIRPYSKEDRLNQKEAAKFLGKSVPTIIEYKKKKIIPFHKIGNSVFYFRSELLRASQKGLFNNNKKQ